MPHASIDERERLLSRLQEHAGTWITDMASFKGMIVVSYYFSLPNHRGGVFDPTARYYTSDGTEVTFSDVPLAKIANDVERCIKTKVPADRRTEIYHKVLTGMPGHKSVPEWDEKSPASIYENPLTPFSKPRDAGVSNQNLLDAFAPAAELSLRAAKGVATQITWRDAMSDGQFFPTMSFCDGVGTGGRLGRKHTVEDVPVNFFRDMLMDWIAEMLEGSEEKKRAARRATCPDLTGEEIEEYARLIAEDRARRDREAERSAAPPTREELARRILDEGRVVRTFDQAMKIVLMNEAVKEIDETVDYETPRPMGVRRSPRGVEGSVITPYWAPLPVYEGGLVPDDEVDRDCDQVRAMIKTFLSSWDWCAETFRDALGSSMTRDRFTAFLRKRGTDAGQLRSAAYLLSWEFFNRRQKLGLSIVDVDFRDDLKALEKRKWQASLTEQQLELAKAQEEECRTLEEKHSDEFRALRDKQDEESEAMENSHAKELKALREGRQIRGDLKALEKKEEEELRALEKKHGEELNALHDRQYEESEALKNSHAKALKALGEGRRGRSGKRLSDGLEGGSKKRLRN